ncbi:arfaptin-2 isoform X5 [Salmo trutta]|uniref:arfaptin-2 isoform X5 n=1 Tax=Salmo trutta TaxID=8032 RepID=UPI0011303948|nr:arfaptin-2-like isoform X5 [Salmo trutta]
MADSFMGKAATMEIPINSNGETLAEDDSLEQAAKIQWTLDEKDLQQVMVSGPNLNETSVVSGGYGGPAGGIIPTSSIKGPAIRFNPQYVDRRSPPAPNCAPVPGAQSQPTDLRMKSRGQGVGLVSSQSAARMITNQNQTDQPFTGSGMHHSNSNQNMSVEEANRGVAVEKLDSVKKWGINTYKCTKQMFSERFGRGSRTVDLELEAQIDVLRDTKRKYESVLRLTSALTSHFYNMVQTQQALGDTFADLSQKSPELRDEFGYNAETQKLLCRNGEALLGAINFFVSSINTLVNKTMEDTLMTIKLYEAARLEFDVFHADLAEVNQGLRVIGCYKGVLLTWMVYRGIWKKPQDGFSILSKLFL